MFYAVQDFADQPHCLLVTVDDDVLLHHRAVEELVAAHHKWPKQVLGFMGTSQGQFLHAERVGPDGVVVDNLGGYRGILYPRSVFHSDFTEKVAELRQVHGSASAIVPDDDLMWSLYLRTHGIKQRVIPTAFPGEPHNFESLANSDGVFGSAHLAKSQWSSQLIQQYFGIKIS